MTAFWIGAAALTVLVLVLLVMPLLRSGGAGAAPRIEHDASVFRDQLAEVDRDVDRGLITEDQADAARLEIKRRVLAAAADSDNRASAPPPRRRHWALAVALSLLLPASAAGLYFALGAPNAPDSPLAARGAPAGTEAGPAQTAPPRASAPGQSPEQMPEQVQQAVARLEQRLATQPDDLRGWVLLGRSYMATERYAEAVDAFATALRLDGGDAAVLEHFGEALTARQGGEVGDEARNAFAAAVTLEPASVKARYYLGLASAQRNDLGAALQAWTDVVALSAPDAPWLETVRPQMARAAAVLGTDPSGLKPSADVAALLAASGSTEREADAGANAGGGAGGGANRVSATGPTAADIAAAAAMPEAEREAMIRSMVERLAGRLRDNPDDRAGWLKLARAYEVLGEPEKAADARGRAEALPAE